MATAKKIAPVGKAKTAAAVTGVSARLTGTIGGLSDAIWALREDKRALDEQVAVIEAKIGALSEQLMEKLDAEGTEKGAGKHCSVSITSNVVGNVTDWNALNAYVKKTGYFHLYQRRLSDPAIRELFETKGSIPGVEPFTKRKLNIRSI
jgi:hypothetical protein